MKHLPLVLIALAFLTSASAQKAAPTDQVSLTGTLYTGIMAEGGETTGTLLTYRDKQGEIQKIEVEVTAQTVGAALVKDRAVVTVTGEVVIHKYVERGNAPRLVASQITPHGGS